jgi:hypothetical protein
MALPPASACIIQNPMSARSFSASDPVGVGWVQSLAKDNVLIEGRYRSRKIDIFQRGREGSLLSREIRKSSGTRRLLSTRSSLRASPRPTIVARAS